MTDRLLLDFDAFFLEHRLCGDTNGDGRRARVDGVRRVWRAGRAAGGVVVMLAVGLGRRRILLGRPGSQWLR